MVKLDYFFEAVVSLSLPIVSSLTMTIDRFSFFFPLSVSSFGQLQAPPPKTRRLLVT